MRLDDRRIVRRIFRHARIGKSAGKIADRLLPPPVADGDEVTRKFKYQALLGGWRKLAREGLHAFVKVPDLDP